jgi:hypothetical protein
MTRRGANRDGWAGRCSAPCVSAMSFRGGPERASGHRRVGRARLIACALGPCCSYSCEAQQYVLGGTFLAAGVCGREGRKVLNHRDTE